MTEERLAELEAVCDGVSWAQGADDIEQEFYDDEGGWLGSTASPHVAETLVAAHNALPELLAEVRRLQHENAQLRKVSEGFMEIAGAALGRRRDK